MKLFQQQNFPDLQYCKRCAELPLVSFPDPPYDNVYRMEGLGTRLRHLLQSEDSWCLMHKEHFLVTASWVERPGIDKVMCFFNTTSVF